MLGWAITLAVIFLIGMTRFGVRWEYSQQGVSVAVKIGPYYHAVLPVKPKTPEQEQAAKKKKDAKAAKKAQKKAARDAAKKQKQEKARLAALAAGKEVSEEADKKGGVIDIVLSAIVPAFDAVGTFFTRMTIDELYIRYTAADSDPFDAVMNYGYASAAMGALAPILSRLHVKKYKLTSDIDVTADKPLIYIKMGVNFRLWEYLYIALRLVFKFVARFIKRKIKSRRAAAERI